MPTPKKNQRNKPVVLIDTNIFAYLVDKQKKDQMFAILNEIEEKYEISISLITYYELVCKGTKDVKIIVNTLKSLKSFEVTEEVLGFAALLFNLYIKKLGDSIIAATSFLNKAFILTADHDFAEPYFHEVEAWHVDYVNSNLRADTVIVHLLEVDFMKVAKAMLELKYIKED